MLYPSNVIEKMAPQDLPNPAPSVRLLSKPGEYNAFLTLVSEWADDADNFKLNISSGEDAFV